MLEISKLLFSGWNEAQLCYCHWKSNEHLLPGLNGDTDLDVLLSEADRLKGEEILRRLDFLQCKSQFGSRYPGVDDWIGFDRGTGKLIHLHLHYYIVTGHKGMKEYGLPWTSDVLSTRKQDPETGVFVSCADYEIVTLYTRMALKISLSDIRKKRKGTYSLDSSYLKEIAYLKERVDWTEVGKIVGRYYHRHADAVLVIMKKQAISPDDLFRLKEMAEETFKTVNRNKNYNRLLEFYYKYALKCRKFVRLKLKKYIILRKVPKSGKGLQIAFLGQDGAGKTTVTNEIRKWWSWKMDVQYIYLGSGDNYFSWRKAIQKRIPAFPVFALVRAWLQLSKYKHIAKDAWTMIKAGEKYAGQGGVVIYDRYPQIQYSGISDGPKIRSSVLKKIPSSLRWMVGCYATSEEKYLRKATEHHPDIVFKLMIPPVESVRRKPENKLEVMEKKHALIKSLQFEGSDVCIIDAMMPLEEELVLIKQMIWDRIQK